MIICGGTSKQVGLPVHLDPVDVSGRSVVRAGAPRPSLRMRHQDAGRTAGVVGGGQRDADSSSTVSAE